MWKLLCAMALSALMVLASHREPEDEEVARPRTLTNTRREAVARAFDRIAELETRIGYLQNYIRELEDTILSHDLPMYRAQ
jgi:hypothetical protein